MTELITTFELAEKLKVHKMTIHRMVKDGRIPCVKLSKTEFRFDLIKVLEALKENTEGLNNDK